MIYPINDSFIVLSSLYYYKANRLNPTTTFWWHFLDRAFMCQKKTISISVEYVKRDQEGEREE